MAIKNRILLMTACLLVVTHALPAAAANWQTPAEALQISALEQGMAPPVSATATAAATATPAAAPSYFQITTDDVADAVAKTMQAQGYTSGVKAVVQGLPNPVLYAANHPLKLVIHALQVDSETRVWQAQAYIMDGTTTQAVKPVTGRYDAVARVPVLTRQLRKGDVIAASDITFTTMTERQLRPDTITDQASMIGQSPTRVISPGRAIRSSELDHPLLVKKGQSVDMLYSTPYMRIRTSGIALEDGRQGGLIRIKNTSSDKAVTGRVVAGGRVEINNDASL